MVMSVCVGGMGDAVLRDRLPGLWSRIEDAHYSYLETDDCPEKLQQKKKLEGYIMEYLSLVPHDCKFGVPETSKVFQRTINEQSEFSAYRAGLGWAALGRYAANLLTQPWRKEYRVIRLYCGYYKHEVEANLVGAETLLHAMGYKPVGPGRLALDAPVCPDMVAAISRDALIAQCECQIMAHIWETAWSSGARVSWSEVAQARAGRGLNVPVTVANIAYGDGLEIYSNVSGPISPQRSRHLRMDSRYHNNIIPQCGRLCPEDSHQEEQINHPMHPQYVMQQNMLPPQLVYEIPPPHLHSEIPLTIPQCNPISMIPTYGAVPYYYPVQTPYMIPTPVFAPVKHATTMPVNGYPPITQYRCPSVPTAQLIELETSVCENGKYERYREDDSHRKGHKHDSRHYSTSKSGLSDVSLPSMPRSDTQPALSKAREDGMGTYESWDYVFRNLSSKEQDAERSRISPSLDRDSRTLDRLDREERRAKYQPTTLDLEDGLQALNLDRSYDEDVYRTAKVNENLMRLKQEQEMKRAKQLVRKQVDERRPKKVEPVLNPTADGLVISKVAPDKVRLLTKKDVKERKDIIKQQNGSVHSAVDVKKVKKVMKAVAIELEKPSKSKPLENGVVGVAHGSKTNIAFNTCQANHDLNAQLIVSFDETDSLRRPTKTQPNDRERSISQTSHIGEKERSNAADNAKKRDRWECGTCTYLNKLSLQACEMCGKSKKGPEIEPLTSGGRECPACTLVNRREAITCDACGTSLEHCPTYI